MESRFVFDNASQWLHTISDLDLSEPSDSVLWFAQLGKQMSARLEV